MVATVADRLRAYLDVLTRDLDEELGGREAARRAHLSRHHFDRLLRAAVGEPPGALRRRLLLERAAFEMKRGTKVIDAALGAGYDSPGSFTRAFAEAHGRPPREFAGSGRSYQIPAPNGIHYHPPASIRVPGSEGGASMDFIDRILEHDDWVTRRILETAATLPADALDRPLDLGQGNHPEVTGTNLRELLDRLVFTKETWTASLTGRPFDEDGPTTPEALMNRWCDVFPVFAATVRKVRDEKGWDDALIDTTCQPPETFVTGAAVLHVVTHTAYRRGLVLGVLRNFGAGDLDWGDPIDWERGMRS